jgi:hypothetical protein
MRVAVARVQQERLCKVMYGPGVQHNVHLHSAAGSAGGCRPESPRSISCRKQCAEGCFSGEACVPIVIPTGSADMESDSRRVFVLVRRIVMWMICGGREWWLNYYSAEAGSHDEQQQQQQPHLGP